jgi:hypothetical protein
MAGTSAPAITRLKGVATMESNLKPVDDPLHADRVLAVLEQFGAFNRCDRCRFARIIGRYQVDCIRGMKPLGMDDGCDLWRPRSWRRNVWRDLNRRPRRG